MKEGASNALHAAEKLAFFLLAFHLKCINKRQVPPNSSRLCSKMSLPFLGHNRICAVPLQIDFLQLANFWRVQRPNTPIPNTSIYLLSELSEGPQMSDKMCTATEYTDTAIFTPRNGPQMSDKIALLSRSYYNWRHRTVPRYSGYHHTLSVKVVG
jgi:hypothetical protein